MFQNLTFSCILNLTTVCPNWR
ncbi:MAG: hypothetical protein J6Q99_03950 [Oscillospiraceae bacterium]|nr:hypothetical protein [Oscillospiraceae bacterium]